VIVEGHTDRAADMAYNDSLAQRRVRAVVAKLVALGGAPERSY
jgi:Outer membrane protein and related peptidoglycan-associated (lipo)proteins